MQLSVVILGIRRKKYILIFLNLCYKSRKGGGIMKKYKNFDEMFHDDDYVSQEEREQINFQVQLIGKITTAREAKGLSQKDLAELSN